MRILPVVVSNDGLRVSANLHGYVMALGEATVSELQNTVLICH